MPCVELNKMKIPSSVLRIICNTASPSKLLIRKPVVTTTRSSPKSPPNVSTFSKNLSSQRCTVTLRLGYFALLAAVSSLMLTNETEVDESGDSLNKNKLLRFLRNCTLLSSDRDISDIEGKVVILAILPRNSADVAQVAEIAGLVKLHFCNEAVVVERDGKLVAVPLVPADRSETYPICSVVINEDLRCYKRLANDKLPENVIHFMCSSSELRAFLSEEKEGIVRCRPCIVCFDSNGDLFAQYDSITHSEEIAFCIASTLAESRL